MTTTDHSYVAPPQTIVGAGVRERAGELLAGLRARHALIVADPALDDLGVADNLTDILGRHDVAADVYSDIKPNPTVADIDRCGAVAREMGCDAIVGLGGGSALDVAKGVALTAAEGWSFEELLERGRPPRRLPKLLLPSTSGSGSEVSQAIVVTDESGHRKMGLHAPWVVADVAVVDPELTASMPPWVTADTGLDAFIHALEALLAANASAPSDALAVKACSIIWRGLPVAFADGDDIAARLEMCTGAMLAGMAFTWSGLGAIHALAYPLTLRHGLSHGRANAVMLPHVLRYTFATVPGSTAAVAAALGLDAGREWSGDELADELVAFVRCFGVSVHLRDAGVEMDALADMAAEAVRPNKRLLATNPCPLTERDVISIYSGAW